MLQIKTKFIYYKMEWLQKLYFLATHIRLMEKEITWVPNLERCKESIDTKVSCNGLIGNIFEFCEERWKLQVHRLKNGKLLHVGSISQWGKDLHALSIIEKFLYNLVLCVALLLIFFPSSRSWYPTM